MIIHPQTLFKDNTTHTLAMMSFAESYVLASKVRSKLTKEAANPKTSLRSLVLQANMLDNLMDHISVQAEQKRAAKVSFAIPKKETVPVGPLVTEYELDSDSDFDSDSESDSEEDDYYYSSDEEDMDVVPSSAALASVKTYKELPVINLLSGHDLSVIFEEEQEDELPELSRSTSDSELEDEVDVPSYTLAAGTNFKISSEDLLKRHGHKDLSEQELHRHQRHNAIFLMESVF